ncbi:MAG: globin [Candidatus Nanopelagicales bacterium]
MTTEPTPYERFGGAEFFQGLVHAFYERVARDQVLRPMYPDHDLAEAEHRLRMFLEQYWGGPKTYGDERGHPRLRMRHEPYPVDSVARDRWLVAMHDALVEQNPPQELGDELWQYFVDAAFAMQNVYDDRPSPFGPQDDAGE